MTEDIEGFRLSPQQRRLFALGQENDRITATLRVRGNVDETVLQSALHHLRERHESLRTDYVSPEIGSLPLQVIRRTEDPVTAVDFSPRQSTDGWLIQISAAALSLDSASLGVILSDLAAFCDGAPPRTDPLQYADASQWFRDQVQDRELASRYFWDERTPPRPSEKPSGKGLVRATVLAKGRARAFRAISGRIGGGEKAVALLCWTRVLASVELNGTDLVDVCFDARPFPELRELVGPTEIIAPLRTTYDADAHAAEIAQRLDAEMADAEEHLFALPVDFPLAPAGFRWQPEFPAEQQGDTAFFYENLCPVGVARDVSISVRRERDDYIITVAVAGDPEKLGLPAPDDLANRFMTLLDGVIADPETPVSRLAILPKAEEARILRQLNQRRDRFQTPPLILDRVFAHAAEQGDRIAAVSLDETITYRALAERSEQAAARLLEAGLSREDVVAIFSDYSIDWLVAVLGVWRAGGACLAIDSALPKTRIDMHLKIAHARFTIGGRQKGWDDPEDLWQMEPEDIRESPLKPPALRPAQLAFVTFTSGTTGRPKAVATEHRHLAAYAAALTDLLAPAEDTRLAMVATPSVDLGMTAWLIALFRGCTIAFPPPAARLDAALFADTIDRLAVDVLKITPTHLSMILDAAGPRALPRRSILFGGEELSADFVEEVRAISPGLDLYNHYGPTETTVGALVHRIETTAGGPAAVPIGRAIAAATAMPNPGGTFPSGRLASELWIGGDGVARGYLGEAALTADRFRPDPHASLPGARAYVTGDLVRLTADANAVYAGRVDDQVKILGNRMELGEVTAALTALASVRQAVTLAVGDGMRRHLEAWAVVSEEAGADAILLALREVLPSAAIPSRLHIVKSIPLLASGKPDRAALLRLAETEACEKRPPHGVVETAIAAIFEGILDTRVEDATASFFEMGGHSLLATLAIARLREGLGMAIDVEAFFTAPTVADLAKLADPRVLERLRIVERIAALPEEDIELELAKRQTNGP